MKCSEQDKVVGGREEAEKEGEEKCRQVGLLSVLWRENLEHYQSQAERVDVASAAYVFPSLVAADA